MGMLGRLIGMMFMMRLESEVPEGMILKSKETGNMFMDEDGRCWCIARCFLQAYIYTHPYKIYLSIYHSFASFQTQNKKRETHLRNPLFDFITLCVTSTYSYRPLLPIFPSPHLMQPLISLAQFSKIKIPKCTEGRPSPPPGKQLPPSSNPSRMQISPEYMYQAASQISQ